MRTSWCCGSHRDPRELQSWQAWTPDLEIEIRPRRQMRAVRSPLPSYYPQTLLCLFKSYLVDCCVRSRARALPEISFHWAFFAALPPLQLLLVYTNAGLLLSASLSTARVTHPPCNLFRPRDSRSNDLYRFWGLIDCCVAVVLSAGSPQLRTLLAWSKPGARV